MNVQATLVNMEAHVQISLTDLDVVVRLGLEDLHAEKVSETLFNIFFLPSSSQSVSQSVSQIWSNSQIWSDSQLNSQSVSQLIISDVRSSVLL